jgi:hypothetical protein
MIWRSMPWQSGGRLSRALFPWGPAAAGSSACMHPLLRHLLMGTCKGFIHPTKLAIVFERSPLLRYQYVMLQYFCSISAIATPAREKHCNSGAPSTREKCCNSAAPSTREKRCNSAAPSTASARMPPTSCEQEGIASFYICGNDTRFHVSLELIPLPRGRPVHLQPFVQEKMSARFVSTAAMSGGLRVEVDTSARAFVRNVVENFTHKRLTKRFNVY